MAQRIVLQAGLKRQHFLFKSALWVWLPQNEELLGNSSGTEPREGGEWSGLCVGPNDGKKMIIIIFCWLDLCETWLFHCLLSFTNPSCHTTPAFIWKKPGFISTSERDWKMHSYWWVLYCSRRSWYVCPVWRCRRFLQLDLRWWGRSALMLLSSLRRSEGLWDHR